MLSGMGPWAGGYAPLNTHLSPLPVTTPDIKEIHYPIHSFLTLTPPHAVARGSLTLRPGTHSGER